MVERIHRFTKANNDVQLKFDVNSFESIMLMEHILKR